MSHKATHWLSEVEPTLMTNAEFRVLFVLCDCHNPSRGCFPKQEYLMDKTGRGSSSVNAALSGLEGKGLIKREQQTNPKNNQRMPTHYILGFDLDASPKPTPNSGVGPAKPPAGSNREQKADPTPNSGDGSISGFQADPSPVFDQSQLLKTGDAIKEEPVKEPVKEPFVAEATQKGFSEFYDMFPRAGDRDATKDAYFAAIESGDVSHAHLIDAVKAYKVDNAENIQRRTLQYLKYSDTWLTERYFDRHPQKATGAAVDLICGVSPLVVKAIQDGKSYLCTNVTPSTARALIAGSHVTPEQCRNAGVIL